MTKQDLEVSTAEASLEFPTEQRLLLYFFLIFLQNVLLVNEGSCLANGVPVR